jgi:anti-sigma factor RsiW
MRHEDIRDRLGEWIDGELDPAVRLEVGAHLSACADCGLEAGRLRRLGSALFAAPLPADPRSTEAFAARVMARVQAEPISVWERLAARVLAPTLALALAGLLLAISIPRADEDADAPLGVAALADADAILGATP